MILESKRIITVLNVLWLPFYRCFTLDQENASDTLTIKCSLCNTSHPLCHGSATRKKKIVLGASKSYFTKNGVSLPNLFRVFGTLHWIRWRTNSFLQLKIIVISYIVNTDWTVCCKRRVIWAANNHRKFEVS